MFLPMSCTSPLTVAVTTRPLARSAGGLVLLRLDERDEVGHRLLHHPRRLDDLRQEHLARAEEVADDVHAVHERTLDHLERAPTRSGDLEAQLLGVGLDVSSSP
jgi:hypothetical protein